MVVLLLPKGRGRPALDVLDGVHLPVAGTLLPGLRLDVGAAGPGVVVVPAVLGDLLLVQTLRLAELGPPVLEPNLQIIVSSYERLNSEQ